MSSWPRPAGQSKVVFSIEQDPGRQLLRWRAIYDEALENRQDHRHPGPVRPGQHPRRAGRRRPALRRPASNPETPKPPAKKMFDPASFIVGLEIGTSKICAAVGEVNAAGSLNIIGLGQARSRGVRKGEIADPPTTEEDVRNAIVEAEQMADVEIRSVYLGVTGSHIRGFNNRGVHPVVSSDREITEDDVQDVIKNAKAINLPAQNYVLHAVRQHFQVDGHDGIVNPVGMLGARVEVDVHVVHGNFNRLQNPIRVVKGLQLEVEAIVFNGLASSLALLTNEQKELGALVIDIGGGTTNYAVYADGIIKHTGVLAVGGDHVSNDLAYGLKVPLGRAEQLKIEHGSALVDGRVKGRTVTISNEFGLPLEDRQPRTSAPRDVPAPGGNFSPGRAGHRAARAAGLPARGGVHLRRRGAHSGNFETGGKGVSNAGFAGQGQLHQRHQIRAGPAGICHRHRAGEIRLLPAKKTRRRNFRRRHQKNNFRDFHPQNEAFQNHRSPITR